MIRLAFIVSHPVQYYVPLYRRLAQRDDVEIKVFFTWHAGQGVAQDHGFRQVFAWDIPLTEGYPFEAVPNPARDPGSHHFWGLRNPALVSSVSNWRPDVVHLTGYAYASHLGALRAFFKHGVPVLFRGDSHLLARPRGAKWLLKRFLLRAAYRWPAGFLYVGKANRAYYEELGVPSAKLFHCPHSIEVGRFAAPRVELERQAAVWRKELGLREDQVVLLFAGKFEDKKRPVALMHAVSELNQPRLVLVLVGDGVLGDEVRRLAAGSPDQFRVLPFQNQSRMPVVYRLGDLFVLPSAYGESWGLAVNEAMACGRPALVSDRVGCAADVVHRGVDGDIFPADNWDAFRATVRELTRDRAGLRSMGESAAQGASKFDIPATEQSLVSAVKTLAAMKDGP